MKCKYRSGISDEKFAFELRYVISTTRAQDFEDSIKTACKTCQ